MAANRATSTRRVASVAAAGAVVALAAFVTWGADASRAARGLAWIGIVAGVVWLMANEWSLHGSAAVLTTALEERTAALETQASDSRRAVRHAPDVVLLADDQGVVRYQSAAAAPLLGFEANALVGTPLADVFETGPAIYERLRRAPAPPAAPLTITTNVRRANQSLAEAEVSAQDRFEDAEVGGLLVSIKPQGLRQIAEDEVRFQALHDPMTGLPNRVLFVDRLAHALTRMSRRPGTVAVVLVAVEGVADIEARLGQVDADRFLHEIAHRLTDCVRDADTLGRAAGDEFAIVLEESQGEGPRVVAERILERMRQPIGVSTGPIEVAATVGIALTSSSTTTPEDLIRDAEIALFRAGDAEDHLVVLYQPGTRRDAIDRDDLEIDLRRALRIGELDLHYQTVIGLPTGRIVGAEALVRWHHPRRGLISAGEFVRLAEESDLIVDLGRWVLREACEHAARFQSVLGAEPPFAMSVNLAPRQLMSPLLPGEIGEILRQTGLAPQSLVLELTEASLMDDAPELAANLHALRDVGVQLAIDDFGTGRSSLSRLRDLPINTLKIDRSFTNEISSADDKAPIVAAIMSMARSLELNVVAEGVETFDQLACLHRHGCHQAQGFLVSRPLPASEFEELLRDPMAKLEAERGTAATPEVKGFAGVVDLRQRRDASMQQVVQATLDQLMAVTGADVVFLGDLQPSGAGLTVRQIAGSGPEAGTVLPRLAVASDGPKVELDLRASQPEHPLVTVHGLLNAVIADVGADSVLYVLSREAGKLKLAAAAMLELFARLIADASPGAAASDSAGRGVASRPLT